MPDADGGGYVDPTAELGDGVTVARGAIVGAGVVIGAGTTIGSGTVVREGVRIGEGVYVEEHVLLGKRPRLRKGSSAAGVEIGALTIGDEATICAGAVVYAGATIGPGAIIGDQTQVRERASVGERSVVGRGSCVDFEARVGNRVLIQTLVYVTGGAIVEDLVFLGPGVMMTNDNAMGRHPHGEPLLGPIVRRAARVGGGVILCPGVEVGEEAFVAAGAVVAADVPARGFVVGVPGRVVRQVADAELVEQWP